MKICDCCRPLIPTNAEHPALHRAKIRRLPFAATLTLGDGAAWRIELLKGASGRTDFSATPLNALCGTREIRMIEEDGVAKVFVRCEDSSPVEARFITTYMCDRFRPLDHASLRDRQGNPRYRDVRESLVCRAARQG